MTEKNNKNNLIDIKESYRYSEYENQTFDQKLD